MKRSMITIPFVREWNIRTPVVVRYLEKTWVDDFFSTGSIRLSCFSDFARHEDEQRKDQREGFFASRATDGKNFFTSMFYYGANAYVLSSSTVHSKAHMGMFSAAYNSGIMIKETAAFAHCVSRRLASFVRGYEGNCVYSDQEQQFEFPPGVDLSDPDNFDPRLLETASFDPDGFFLKEPKYSHQSEYRFVWIVSDRVGDGIVIRCPEARQFCEEWLPEGKPTIASLMEISGSSPGA